MTHGYCFLVDCGVLDFWVILISGHVIKLRTHFSETLNKMVALVLKPNHVFFILCSILPFTGFWGSYLSVLGKWLSGGKSYMRQTFYIQHLEDFGPDADSAMYFSGPNLAQKGKKLRITVWKKLAIFHRHDTPLC